MIYNLAILFPCAICLMWFALYLLKSGKESWQKVWMLTLLVASVTFFCDASIMESNPNYEDIPYFDILHSLFAPMVPIASFLFVQFVRGAGFHVKYLAMLVVPLALCVVVTVIYISMGQHDSVFYVVNREHSAGRYVPYYDRLSYLQFLFNECILKIVLVIEIVLFLLYLLRIMIQNKFNMKRVAGIFRTGEILIEDAVVVFMFIMFCFFLAKIVLRAFVPPDHQMLNILVCFVESAITMATCHTVTYSSRGAVTLSQIIDITHSDGSNAGTNDESVGSGLNSEIPIGSYDRFLNDFMRIVIADERYLDPELSIDSLAREMHTNRTYLSRLVNRRFKMSFRDYINTRRIDHAKSLMKRNPTALMETIAKNSGFMTTSQFNRKFKELEGMSPRVWQISHAG